MLAETYTRKSTGKGYRFNRAQELFSAYPSVHTVEFHERGDGDRTHATPGVIVYFVATTGRYGRSKSVRIHPRDEHEARMARQLAARKAAEDRLWTPELRALAAELEKGNCYRLVLVEYGYDWQFRLIENLHDVHGQLQFAVATAEEVRRHVSSGLHESVYHNG